MGKVSAVEKSIGTFCLVAGKDSWPMKMVYPGKKRSGFCTNVTVMHRGQPLAAFSWDTTFAKYSGHFPKTGRACSGLRRALGSDTVRGGVETLSLLLYIYVVETVSGKLTH